MQKGNSVKETKKPWPTKKAMEQVYDMKLWGDNKTEFYSGEGSHNPEIVIPYITVISEFLKSFKKPLVVCDLGCGDFNIGKEFVKHTQKYIGVDIVKQLIDFNQQKFKQENLEFQCLDIATDELPVADCVILRQVLQHLSNAELENIVKKLTQYKYLILTEHIPTGDFIPNKDIISGQGIRLKKKSGVNLLVAPFNLKVSEEKELLSVIVDNNKGRIVTTLYRLSK